MRPKPSCFSVLTAFLVVVSIVGAFRQSHADPSKYPQFAQHQLPENVTPAFIYIDQLVAEVSARTKPLIIDVRSGREFEERHILGAVSVPLESFASHVESIPKDRLVVLY
jgi:Rhodanese-like domain